MAANKSFRFGPVALSVTTTTNILNPGTTTGGVASTAAPYNELRIYLRHVRVVNKTASAASCALWIGATGANAAGTEAIFGGAASGGALTQGQSVPANSFIEWTGQPNLPLNVADFLVGGAGTATALTIEGEGEIGVA